MRKALLSKEMGHVEIFLLKLQKAIALLFATQQPPRLLRQMADLDELAGYCTPEEMADILGNMFALVDKSVGSTRFFVRHAINSQFEIERTVTRYHILS